MRNNPAVSNSVRVRLIESGGLHLATSPDVPTLWAASFDLESILEEIEQAICEHYDALGFEIRTVQNTAAAAEGALTFHILPLRLEAAE